MGQIGIRNPQRELGGSNGRDPKSKREHRHKALRQPARPTTPPHLANSLVPVPLLQL